jgi:hypothetical protein
MATGGHALGLQVPEEEASRNATAALSAQIQTVLGALLVVVGSLLLYLLVRLWPAVAAATGAQRHPQTISVFGIRSTPSPDGALLMLVVLASAVGSYVHAATSFSTYVGNRALAHSWIWWYLLRVFIGASLALLVYFAFRGGLLAQNADAEINPYGIAALAGLSGLFSKQATDKLHEVFDTLFSVGKGYGDDTRKGGLNATEPGEETTAPAEGRSN